MKHVFVGFVVVAFVGLIFLKVKCQDCNGTGQHKGRVNTEVVCSRCKGSGHIPVKSEWLLKRSNSRVHRMGEGSFMLCPVCHGTGHVDASTRESVCETCEGTGRVRLYVKLLGQCKRR